MEKFATEIAVLKLKCELNLQDAEDLRKQTPLAEKHEKGHQQQLGKEEKEEELYTPASKDPQPYQRKIKPSISRHESRQEVNLNPLSSNSNDSTTSAIAESSNNVNSTSDENMIWDDVRTMLTIVTEHKPAYWDKVKNEIEMKLPTVDILKPSFDYKKDGFKYHIKL